MNDASRLPIPAEITERLIDVMSTALLEAEIAEDFQVNDEASAALAGEQLSAVAKMIKRLDEERLGYTRPYDALKADIKTEYDKPVAKLQSASKALRSRLSAWADEQERKRQELLRQERERIERERAEAAKALAREEERLAKLKSAGAQERAADRVEDAKVALEQASVSTPLVAAPAKVKGFSQRKELKADYQQSDIVALAAAVVANPRLAHYLLHNTVEINKVVKAMQSGATDIIPGLKLVEATITSAR